MPVLHTGSNRVAAPRVKGSEPSEARVIQDGRLEWMLYAACREADERLFFGPLDEPAPDRQRREDAALRWCAACPVRRICRDVALSRGERYGVWGGLAQAELRRRRHATARAAR